MRVAEPHHDGTPHWHLLLFIPKDQATIATSIFAKYALQEDGDEAGAKEHRLKTVLIDPAKGSATGYVAKYISKNIDGYNVEDDHYGRNAIESATRIEAWASIWGIRQFQQIGGASVTVWRELRRIEAESIDKHLLKSITEAADGGNWALYTELMGGAVCPRRERPIRPMMIEKTESNRYGEAVRVIKGIWHGAEAHITRIHEWVVRVVKDVDKSTEESEDGVGFGAAVSAAPPGARAPLEFCQ